MTAELILHILLAFSLCAVAFALIWAVQILGELNVLSRDIVRLYDDLKEQIVELETEVHKAKKDSHDSMYDDIRKQILEGLRQRWAPQRPNTKVEGDDKLDFPNEH